MTFDLPRNMGARAAEAVTMLKAISHEDRLMLLCHLVEGEKSVNELETLLNLRQATVSQHLARLRLDGFVVFRREGKTVFYTLADERTRLVIQALHDVFCPN